MNGKQASRSWAARKLKEMRKAGGAARMLAHLVRHAGKTLGKPLESFIVIHDINTATGRLTERSAAGKVSHELKSILRQVASNSHAEDSRLAVKSLRDFKMIRNSNMARWLSHTSFANRTGRVLSSAGAKMGSMLGKSARVLARFSGPLFIAGTAALEAYELQSLRTSYLRGDLSRREYLLESTKVVSGFAGAVAGAVTGGLIGAHFGGILAPIGAAVGGTIGYFTIRTAAGETVKWRYRVEDNNVEKRLCDWFHSLPCPLGL